MARAKLFLPLVVLSLAALLAAGCAGQLVTNATPEGQIVIEQFGGAGILSADCLDRDYISDTADYIIEGTVKRVRIWFRLNDERGFIFTYTDLPIEKYVTGAPFKEDKLQIVTPVTTIRWLGMWSEHCQPTFHKGRKVRIYLQERNGEFSIVCGPAELRKYNLRLARRSLRKDAPLFQPPLPRDLKGRST